MTLDPAAALLLENDLQVSGLGDVQEVLRVAAPELVLLAVIKYSLSTRGLEGPLALILLL